MKKLKDNLKNFEWGILLFAWGMYGIIALIFVSAYHLAVKG